MLKRMLVSMLLPFLLFYAFPAGAVEKEERTWQDEIIYLLMVDRFQNSDSANDLEINTQDPLAYQGGDFQGIIDQLDYIQDMGFTTIWLTPVFSNEAGGYHGYWVDNFYETEAHFGTIDKFKEVVKEAHKREMKVMIDFVANYVGPNHPWVADEAKKDWFLDEKAEVDSIWFQGLPKLNHANPDVKQYLMDAAVWWITETDIDGYRLHAVNEAPVDFWEDFSKEVKAVKDDFFLLGQVRSDHPQDYLHYEKAGIDGFLDYPLHQPMRKAFAKPDTSLDELFAILDEGQETYQQPSFMGAFFDDHEMKRFTRDMVENNEFPGGRWKLALSFLYTIPDIPVVYYGTEIAIDGGEIPDNQKMMSFRSEKELVDYMTRLAEVRSQYPALTKGNLTLLESKDGLAVYKRQYEDETIVIAINNTTEDQKVSLTADQLENDKELRSLIGTDMSRSENGTYQFVIKRESSDIYKLENRSGINYFFVFSIFAVFLLFSLFMYAAWKRGKRRTTS